MAVEAGCPPKMACGAGGGTITHTPKGWGGSLGMAAATGLHQAGVPPPRGSQLPLRSDVRPLRSWGVRGFFGTK
jgi:hypothetical protein